MPFNTHRQPSEDLTVLTAEGELSFDEIVRTVKAFYEGPDPTQKAMWDLRRATLRGIASSDMRRIAEFVGTYARDRREEKTAFVVETDLDYGIMRMYEGHASHLPVRMGVFRSLEEALEWLSGNC